MADVLIVDHEKEFYQPLAPLASAKGINIVHASCLLEGIDKINSNSFDLVLLKDRLPDGTAVEGVSSLLNSDCSPAVIVISQQGDPDEAEQLLKSGVMDYIINPDKPDFLLDLLERTIRCRNEERAGYRSPQSEGERTPTEGIVGSSSQLQSCLNIMAKAAQSDANVLITGESGTGKELFASAIHNLSSRSANNFVVVDCAALPQTLVESILFGHEKGAFTGADKNKPGLIKQADKGTLFLDEVGELPLNIQKKFLRVLQEHTFRPVGSNFETRSNFRLIAATNRNPQGMSQKGEFREDLLFRLQTFHLELPPLRERQSDITELAYYYKERYSRFHKEKEKHFSTDFLMTLKRYTWPGNVRELFNALERSIATAHDSETLYPIHLPTNIRIQVIRQSVAAPSKGQEEGRVELKFSGDPSQTLQSVREQAVAEIEKKYLRQLVLHTAGDVKKCCQLAGLSRSRFYGLLKKYQIPTVFRNS